mmetsp:Transcript_9415/g.28650  ORF Transcript_9415/g.28650 Transcript_9415/m.28650 type:complete len:250 (-) Transcript_9415:261-1010(-)
MRTRVMFSFSLKAAIWRGVRPLRSGTSTRCVLSTLEWLSMAMIAASDLVATAKCSAVPPLLDSIIASAPRSSSSFTISGWLYSAASMSGVLPCLSCQLRSSCSLGVMDSNERVCRRSPPRASLCSGISPFSSSMRTSNVVDSSMESIFSASLNSHASRKEAFSSRCSSARITDVILIVVTPAALRSASVTSDGPYPRPRLLRRLVVSAVLGGLRFSSASRCISASFDCTSRSSRIFSSVIPSSVRSTRS